MCIQHIHHGKYIKNTNLVISLYGQFSLVAPSHDMDIRCYRREDEAGEDIEFLYKTTRHGIQYSKDFNWLKGKKKRKVPSPREPLLEVFSEPSCEEKGSFEGSGEP